MLSSSSSLSCVYEFKQQKKQKTNSSHTCANFLSKNRKKYPKNMKIKTIWPFTLAKNICFITFVCMEKNQMGKKKRKKKRVWGKPINKSDFFQWKANEKHCYCDDKNWISR